MLSACKDDLAIIQGDYLGQKPPGQYPEKFMPDIVSTSQNEINCIFTPDKNELFMSVWTEGLNTIYHMQKNDRGIWSERAKASFSGKYSDVDPYVSADGARLYFSSKRPLITGNESKDSDIWTLTKMEDGSWGNIQNLDFNDTIADDYYTSISRHGSIYYSKFESHGSPGDICFTSIFNGKYAESKYLDYPVNTDSNEHDPFINYDEGYLIFSSDRPGGYGRGDLYITFKNDTSNWSEPVNLGEEINTEHYEFCPMVSHDGKYFFFTRNVNGNGDIFWVDASIIDKYRSHSEIPD
jgi:Tol biopolymer transport system component